MRKRFGALVAFSMLASMLVVPVAGASPEKASGTDHYRYTFTFTNGTTVTGTSSRPNPLVHGVGGTDADAPTGTRMLVSCDDRFVGGWGQKAGPSERRDGAWHISSYRITTYDKGKADKTCSGGVAPEPSIDIEQLVNGEDADVPPGPSAPIGSLVTVDYLVTNTGNVELDGVAVTDTDLGPVVCPASTLSPGQAMTCESNQVEVTSAGVRSIEATVEGRAVVEGTPVPPPFHGKKRGFAYSFTFVNGKTISGTSTRPNPFIPEIGGADPDAPTGTRVLLTCAERFVGGWARKAGPNQRRDPAWQISSYRIITYQKGQPDKSCSGSYSPVEIVVTDQDPSHFTGVTASAVDIEMSVNGFDADTADGRPTFLEGNQLEFGYVVTNTGDTSLTDVSVNDRDFGTVICPETELDPGQSMTCTPRTAIAVVGTLFTGEADVTADGNGAPVSDTDPVNYRVDPDFML